MFFLSLSNRKKQHNTNPALVPCPLVPHFPRHTALPYAFWRALITRYMCCFLELMKQNCLMLHHLEIRGCVSIKQAHSCADMACGWLVTRLVVKYTTLFQGWMTAISTKLMVRHLFSQQASVSDEWLRMALTFHCFGLTCMTVCIAMQASPLPFT